ncbi:hypothetical protein PAMP_008182 [Pampus punctatissimus]
MVSLNEENEKLKLKSEELDSQYTNEDLQRESVVKLVAMGKKLVQGMETSVNELLLKFQKKKAENDVCQAEKKIKDDELAAIQNENAKTEGLLKADSDAWKQEISTLKEQLLGYSKICDYVKDKAQAVKLCTQNMENPINTQKTGINNE